MGRSSVDIIKPGGYKLSALEIENTLLAHPQIAEVVVVGIADRTWGEAVAAVVALKGDHDMTLEDLRGPERWVRWQTVIIQSAQNHSVSWAHCREMRWARWSSPPLRHYLNNLT